MNILKSVTVTILLCAAALPSAAGIRLKLLYQEYVYQPGDFPSCHASTIAETSQGELLAAFFGGPYEGHPDCCIWLSRRGPEGWSEPVKVADGMTDSVKVACYNPVLFQIPGGDLLLFYKVGENVQAWKGYLIKSSDGGHTWTSPEQLPGEFLGPVRNKPVLLGDRLICGSSLEKGGWRVYIEETDKNCSHWTRTGPLNDMTGPVQIIQPTFFHHKGDDGEQTWSIYCRSRRSGDPIMSSSSPDCGHYWSEVFPTALTSNNSGIDGISIEEGKHLLVYNHPTAEKPAARTPLVIALSDDLKEWRDELILEDAPDAEFSYPAVIRSADGLIHIVYTDRRTRIKHAVVEIISPASSEGVPEE